MTQGRLHTENSLGKTQNLPSERVLVTGGSGFIGTNLVGSLLARGAEVLSVDIMPPRNPAHQACFRSIDCRHSQSLAAVMRDFAPTQVVHLAARTDLDGRSVEDYAANTAGTRNLLEALNQTPSVCRCLFTSTRLVRRTGDPGNCETDYAPHTFYGESKAIGEQLVRRAKLNCAWCIGRPTSIWGPWFGVPYRAFFIAVAKGYYVHPRKVNPPRALGYVGNVVHQIETLLTTTSASIHGKTFYYSDYVRVGLKEWADAVSLATRGRTAREAPLWAFRLAARAGDALRACGIEGVPMTSFRLTNMLTDTTDVSLEAIRALAPELPFSLEEGVRLTTEWLRSLGMI